PSGRRGGRGRSSQAPARASSPGSSARGSSGSRRRGGRSRRRRTGSCRRRDPSRGRRRGRAPPSRPVPVHTEVAAADAAEPAARQAATLARRMRRRSMCRLHDRSEREKSKLAEGFRGRRLFSCPVREPADSMAVDAGLLPERYAGAQPIGRGGMGEIYRATDTSLGRAVAIKVLAARYAQEESVRERFTREALAVARLSGYPNIVTIYDVGEHDARPFIVMEYLAGGSLEQRLAAEGAQPPRLALEWLEQAANALDAAHRNGVVHRDVKPANLLLDRNGRVHVADFGIARAAGLQSLTQSGTVLGTASYLSPEQAQGEQTSAASDIYSLGVVAFELLTGRRPFEGTTVAAEAAAHVTGEVPSVRDVDPELPQELDPVFAKVLAKDPARRYGSAAEFVAALRAALDEAAGTTGLVPRVRALPPTPPVL